MIAAIPRPSGDENEDLSEYKFQKYAGTYFQGNVNHQYSRKQLKSPLLNLQHNGDQLVCVLLFLVWFDFRIMLKKYFSQLVNFAIYLTLNN